MTIETTQGPSSANLLTPGYPVVGGDVPGQNLVIRSNNSAVKGTVLLDEGTPSVGPNSGALQTLGGIGAQHNVSAGGAFLNMPFGYSVSNIMVPSGLNGYYPGSSQYIVSSSIATSNGIVTITFVQTQTFPPFYVGQLITIAGVAPAGYNGTYAVTACTTTTVSYANTTTGSQTAQGLISAATNSTIAPSVVIGPPQISGGIQATALPVMNNTTLIITATSGSGSVATLTFTAQPLPPFVVGQLITVAGVTPTGYNGQFVVTACTTTTVSYASATTGSITATGYVASASVVGVTITNPGTGYTSPPSVTFSDPTPGPAPYWGAGAVVTAYQQQFLTVTGGTSSQTLSGVAIAGTNGQFTCTAPTGYQLAVGVPLTISGTFGGTGSITGYSNPTTYWIISTNGTTSFTLSATPGGPAITTTAGTPTGLTYTVGIYSVTFTAQTVAPMIYGQTVTIGGVVSSGNGNYNGTFMVLGSSTTAIYYNGGSLTPTYTSGGTAVSAGSPPVYTKTTTSGGQVYYYQVMYGGTYSGTAPSHLNGTVANGTAYLTFIGTLAQGYSAIGYSGIITQGAYHQLGAVSQVVVTSVGAGYVTVPTITLSRPDMVGGRQATAYITALSSGTVIPANVVVTDPGSGYLYPPTVTFSTPNTGITPAAAVAVISSPGEKPIVSQIPTSTSNAYYLDFGLTGHNVAMLTTGASSTIYFDNLQNSGAPPYFHGFPQGRKIVLYVKNTSGSTITITLPGLTAANTSNNSANQTISATRTARFEFQVLTTSNLQNTAGASGPGGTAADVYATIVTS